MRTGYNPFKKFVLKQLIYELNSKIPSVFLLLKTGFHKCHKDALSCRNKQDNRFSTIKEHFSLIEFNFISLSWLRQF